MRDPRRIASATIRYGRTSGTSPQRPGTRDILLARREWTSDAVSGRRGGAVTCGRAMIVLVRMRSRATTREGAQTKNRRRKAPVGGSPGAGLPAQFRKVRFCTHFALRKQAQKV